MIRTPVPRSWLVEYDPEGVFQGAFTRFDLEYTARMGNWPEGITFRHTRTGARAQYRNGTLYINGRVAARKTHHYQLP